MTFVLTSSANKQRVQTDITYLADFDILNHPIGSWYISTTTVQCMKFNAKLEFQQLQSGLN